MGVVGRGAEAVVRQAVVTGMQWQSLWRPHGMPDASTHLQSQQEGERTRGKVLIYKNSWGLPDPQVPKPAGQQWHLESF